MSNGGHAVRVCAYNMQMCTQYAKRRKRRTVALPQGCRCRHEQSGAGHTALAAMWCCRAGSSSAQRAQRDAGDGECQAWHSKSHVWRVRVGEQHVCKSGDGEAGAVGTGDGDSETAPPLTGEPDETPTSKCVECLCCVKQRVGEELGCKGDWGCLALRLMLMYGWCAAAVFVDAVADAPDYAHNASQCMCLPGCQQHGGSCNSLATWTLVKRFSQSKRIHTCNRTALQVA